MAAYWDGVIGRFIEGTRQRLRLVGLRAEHATALVWMSERTCYQQAVRGETGLDDDTTIGALTDVWWSAILAARAAL